jgi:phosphotransacetylase
MQVILLTKLRSGWAVPPQQGLYCTGLSKPFMDLSRGCSVDDIVNTACVGILLSMQAGADV